MSPWPSLATIAALLMYFAVTLNVGRARFKYGVQPPQTSGDPAFERALRAQQNTVEQMILFLPSLWLFALYVNDQWAGGLGALWVVGRAAYAWGYAQAAEKRLPGFALGMASTLILLVGSLVGILRSF